MLDPNSCAEMDVALANLIHGKNLPFNFAKDMKLMKVIYVARGFPVDYKPPSHNSFSDPLLDTLYDVHCNSETRTLLADSRIFGISLFVDGAKIKTVPMVNALATGVNNPFAFLDVFD